MVAVITARLRWLRVTPLGIPVVPEVWLMKAGASLSGRGQDGWAMPASVARRHLLSCTSSGAEPSLTNTLQYSACCWRAARQAFSSESCTSSADAWVRSRMPPSLSALICGFSGTQMAPRRNTAYRPTTRSGPLSSSTPTRSPSVTPSACSCVARPMLRWRRCAYVMRWDPQTSAVLSGSRAAVRSSSPCRSVATVQAPDCTNWRCSSSVETMPTKAMLSGNPIARPLRHLSSRWPVAAGSNRPLAATLAGLINSATHGSGSPSWKKQALSGDRNGCLWRSSIDAGSSHAIARFRMYFSHRPRSLNRDGRRFANSTTR